MNLADDLVLRAASTPDRIGLHFEDGRSWPYLEIDEQSSRVAAFLRSRGLGPGSRAAIFLQNCPELVFLLFGCWKAGVASVALSALYNREELKRSLAKAAPGILLTGGHSDFAAEVAAELSIECVDVGLGGRGLNRLPPAPVEGFVPVEAGPDLEGTVLFTGGTTGVPKAVVASQAGSYETMVTLAVATKGGRKGPYPSPVNALPPNLVALPLFHGGGLQNLLFAYHVGRDVVLMERFRVEVVARLVAEHGIDNLFLLPTMLFDLAEAPSDISLGSVNKVLVAGQALDPGLKRRFEERYGLIVFSNYGSGEIGHVAGWTPADVREGRWKPGSVGRVYDGVDVEVRDADGEPLGTGESGEIWVRSSRTLGYLEGGAPAAGDLIRDGWVRSGDRGYLDGDRVLFLTGRLRDLIKTGGFQVWPGEIETELLSHPAVRDVAVVGAPDPRLGEIPKAFVVVAPGATAGPDLAAELIAFCRDRLAHFKAIRAVEFIDRLPRSEVGKVQRGELLRQGQS